MPSENTTDFFRPATPGAHAPEFVIVSSLAGSRLRYVAEFIFTTVFHCRVSVETELLQNDKRHIICYGEKRGGGSFHIRAGRLIQSNKKPSEEVDYDPFEEEDFFSFVFYFISRYEEWLDFPKDAHRRFEASASILFRKNMLQQPVVDERIMQFRETLKAHFGSIAWPEKKFRVISTIDVDNLYAYRHKGMLRTTGALIRDALKGNFGEVRERLAVINAKRKDPFDIYERVVDFSKSINLEIYWFFLLRDGTAFDRTVSDKNAFRSVFEKLRMNHQRIGLHPSYFTVNEISRLQSEVGQFAELYGSQPQFCRQHYLRFDIKKTPRELEALGVKADFTMGFASKAGFRAGTSHPFRYFDFYMNEAANILLVPFCAMDGAYTVYENADPEEAFRELVAIGSRVQATGGYFTTVFHERTFDDRLYSGFGSLYERLHLHFNSGNRI